MELKAKDMIVGHWYQAYGLTVKCMGPMADAKYMMVGVDGDTDMQSCEGWPLDKDVVEVSDPYAR